MKTMRLGKYFLSIVTMAFLLFSTGNAFATPSSRNCDHQTGTPSNPAQCESANNFIVVAPYWQVDSGSYTFIAVTHSSLSGMASQIGLHVNAITSDGTAYDTAETFSLFSGTTQRLFIVPTGHSTINATAIPTAKFMTGTSDYTYGSIRVTPSMSHPQMKYTRMGHREIFNGDGFRDITMLSYWGSVVIEANTTGFAMEFLGDMNDSQASVPTLNSGVTTGGVQVSNCHNATTKTFGVVGDVQIAYANCQGAGHDARYEVMSTGPNLQ
jgi:hypothetical protein